MPPGIGFGGNVRMGMGPAGMMLGGGGGGGGGMMLGAVGGGGRGGGMMHGGGGGGGSDLMMEAFEPPPPGCAPDAIKLFVGNVPKSCSEEQIRPFFETIGKVQWEEPDEAHVIGLTSAPLPSPSSYPLT